MCCECNYTKLELESELTIGDRQLTRSILRADFSLQLELPPDRLCPPVPVRWNYVHWIQELLDTTSENYGERYDADRDVIGIDIGTGASAIYPLLACGTRPRWRMLGTDVDAHSLDYAKQNVTANNLAKRIRLSRSETAEAPLLPLDKLGIEELDFCMTNPPFYSSQEDMLASYGAKAAAPSAICTGAENEMICPDGDVGFVSRIIDESLQLKERVRWYTAMLGRLGSLQAVIEKLKKEGITNWAVTCLQAGRKTKRWAVAWSFQDYRPRNDVARHGDLVKAVLPHVTANTIEVPLLDQGRAGKRVDETVRGLNVKWEWRALHSAGVMGCRENVWSRSARRKMRFGGGDEGEGKKDEGMGNGEGEETSEEEDEVALAVKVTCEDKKVEVRWLRGMDHVLFESFCGMLKRALLGPA